MYYSEGTMAYLLKLGYFKGATTLQKLGSPNRAKPESRARSTRDLGAKPKSRAKPKKEGSWEGAR